MQIQERHTAHAAVNCYTVVCANVLERREVGEELGLGSVKGCTSVHCRVPTNNVRHP